MIKNTVQQAVQLSKIKMNSMAVELFNLKRKRKDSIAALDKQIESITSSIIQFLDNNGEESMTVEFVKDKYSPIYEADKKLLKKITASAIQYDAEKVEKKLGKETSLEVIDKEYMITDIDGLIKYLKSCGVNPQKFKSFISVDKRVNKENLEQMYQRGEIDLEDLAGCYTVKESKPYLSFSEIKEEVIEE